MISFALDAKNNLIIENDIATVNGIEALAQDIKTMITLHLKEYIYDTSLGVDWMYFVKYGDTQSLLAEIEQQIYRDGRVMSCVIDAAKDSAGLVITVTTRGGEEVVVNVGSY